MFFLCVGMLFIAINVGLDFFLTRFLFDKSSHFSGLAFALLWLWIWPRIPPLNLVSIAGSLFVIYGISSLLTFSPSLTLLCLGGTIGILMLVSCIRENCTRIMFALHEIQVGIGTTLIQLKQHIPGRTRTFALFSESLFYPTKVAWVQSLVCYTPARLVVASRSTIWVCKL